MMITKCNDESLWLSQNIYELFNSDNLFPYLIVWKNSTPI